MLKQNKRIPNIKEKYGNLLINAEIPMTANSNDSEDAIIIYYLESAYKLLEKQNNLYDLQKPYLSKLSLTKQVQDSVKNALELLSLYNQQSLSSLIGSTSLCRSGMLDFLDKWKKKHSISSKNDIYL